MGEIPIGIVVLYKTHIPSHIIIYITTIVTIPHREENVEKHVPIDTIKLNKL